MPLPLPVKLPAVILADIKFAVVVLPVAVKSRVVTF
jgi:hypothetical protein